MISVDALTIAAGVSSVFGFAGLVAYLYFLFFEREAERSIQRKIEGNDSFTAKDIVKILKTFKNDALRLKALVALTRFSSEKAAGLLNKIKGDIDIEKLSKIGANNYERRAIILAAFFLILAGVLYLASPRPPLGAGPAPSPGPGPKPDPLALVFERRADFSRSECGRNGRAYHLEIIDTLRFSADPGTYAPLATVNYPLDVRLYDLQNGGAEVLPSKSCQETPANQCATNRYDYPAVRVVDGVVKLRWDWTSKQTAEPVRFRSLETKPRFPMSKLHLDLYMPRDVSFEQNPDVKPDSVKCPFSPLDRSKPNEISADCTSRSADGLMTEGVFLTVHAKGLDCPAAATRKK